MKKIRKENKLVKELIGKYGVKRACGKKSVNKKAFYDKIKKIIGGNFYVKKKNE